MDDFHGVSEVLEGHTTVIYLAAQCGKLKKNLPGKNKLQYAEELLSLDTLPEIAFKE